MKQKDKLEAEGQNEAEGHVGGRRTCWWHKDKLKAGQVGERRTSWRKDKLEAEGKDGGRRKSRMKRRCAGDGSWCENINQIRLLTGISGVHLVVSTYQ